MSDKTKQKKQIEPEALKVTLTAAESSLKLLFTELKNGQTEYINIFRHNFIVNYLVVLHKVLADLNNFSEDKGSANRLVNVLSPEADSIDALNQLYFDCKGKKLAECLDEAVFDAFIMYGVLDKIDNPDPDALFCLQHAEQLCASVKALADFVSLLNLEVDPGQKLLRLRPGVENMLDAKSCVNLPDGKISAKSMEILVEKALEADPFSGGNTFRYLNEKFISAELNSIRPADEFFGYFGVRKTFKEHFLDFSRQRTNLPLLVSSLPGLGKTQMTIANTLEYENLTLILPEPEDLEKPLQHLIEKLANRKDRRFLIFFDDVDPASINWYYFRTNVGGSFTLPDNVSIVIASNFEFPANILSRGRAVKFPLFDEIRCLEMIEEFLRSRGLKHRNPNLELVIAADYIEDFGQRKFEELSPRTLMRYLEIYQSDMKKRKRMLDMTRMEVFAKPDPQVFYEFNAKLMRSLYGEQVLDVLQEENLKQQLGTV